jgi:pilus assembly protein Flp/PilA
MRDLVKKLRTGMWAVVFECECFMMSEDGQDMVEYALVMGLIAMGAVAATKGLATSIGVGLTSLGTKLAAYTS